MSKLDYTPLDLPQITHYMFYPRPDSSPPPTGALDHTFPSHDNVQLCGRFFPKINNAPPSYSSTATVKSPPNTTPFPPFTTTSALNLFVTDYRGYGKMPGRALGIRLG